MYDCAGGERVTYNAYGKQKITDASGNVTRQKSAVGFDRGFTGYVADNETGLLYARNRMYSSTLGRFVNRDNMHRVAWRPISLGKRLGGGAEVWYLPKSGDGYQDGLSMYGAYFVPNALDPSGNSVLEWCCKRICDAEVVTAQALFGAAFAAGVLAATAGAIIVVEAGAPAVATVTVVVAVGGFTSQAIKWGSGLDIPALVDQAASDVRNAWNTYIGQKWAACYQSCETNGTPIAIP